MSTAIIAIDYINEIVHPDGKLAGKGYAEFVAEHGTIGKVRRLVEKAGEAELLTVAVRVAFSPDYADHPADSPLFAAARPNGALMAETWATEFIEGSGLGTDTHHIVTKRRVSAFHSTDLDTLLRSSGVNQLVVCGVATDLAVQSAVRQAHDLDYKVTVISDCCAAATLQDHEESLRVLAKLADVATLDSFAFGS